MLIREMFGTDLYHLVAAFIIYSILGWFVESVYMSFCNKKVTNRGFVKSPFCPIYGFGAIFGYAVLRPLASDFIRLYITGAILATIFEFLVGKGMLRIFGEVWWDYHNKPFNYKGIICLESTVAWGFYAIAIVGFLHQRLLAVISRVPVFVGVRVMALILLVVAIDFTIQIMNALHVDMKEKRDWLVAHYHSVKAHWS
jgi:uncharacterized membrane protein